MVRIEYHADLKEVQSDAQLAALLSDQSQHAPFDRLAWWQGLTEHCGLKPMFAAARSGESAAILPLASQGRGSDLAALANWYTFRFRPIMSGPRSADLLAALARDVSSRADRIVLKGVPDEDGSATALAAAFRTAGWTCLRTLCDTNQALSVDGRTYDQFIAGRPGALRTTLKRKSKKLQTEVFTTFDEPAWADYHAIYAESWKPEEGSPAFLRAFAEAEGAAGRLRLGIARADGEPVAAQLWTVESGTAFIHKLAYRRATSALSPGSVLSAALFRHVIDIDGVATIDFGTGDNPFKHDWMELARPRYTLELLRPTAPRNWPVLALAGLRRLAHA